MSFDHLVAQINTASETQRDRGTYFEYLARAYFQNEPTYKNEFKNVWMLSDVPAEFGIPKTDIGVDLVAEKHTGELVAIQAKFYNHAIQKKDIDSFLGELGKDYYESGIIVASTDKWGANAEKALKSLYRPFTKKSLYYDNDVIERPGQWYKKFGEENLVIMTTGKGISREFSALVTNVMPNLHAMDTGQHFMRYDNEVDETALFQSNDNMNQSFADKLGLSLDDTFAYVYGLLNSREYQEKYANDLKKDLARIPIVEQKEKYVEVGKALMDLHLNYEEVPVYDDVDIQLSARPSYKVTKMKFAKTRDENGKSINDRSTIIHNSDITISCIPEKAYEYMVARLLSGFLTSTKWKQIKNQASPTIQTITVWTISIFLISC